MLQAYNTEAEQVKMISRFFAEELNTSSNKISVELIHTPDIAKELFSRGQLEVQYGRGKFNLGHQTLWLVHKLGSSVKQRYPVTVDVTAMLDVPSAKRKISRLELITPNLISMEEQNIGREYRRILTDATRLFGKMSTQVIREGRVIERNMVRTRPDVLMGDHLQIILLDEGLHLELPGVAKEEGLIGQAIRVQCPTTRKEFSGILESQTEVLVTLR